MEIGNPAEKITAVAGEEKYDLVIMGTHGHGKLEEAFVGSVAREVIRRCPVPVMVVRLPESRMEKRNLRRDQSPAAADTAQTGRAAAVK